MARTGRPPTPTAIKRLHGVRSSRINDDEPLPGEQRPEPPQQREESWLAIWDRTVTDLEVMHLGPYRADQAALVALVDAVWHYDRIAGVITKSPAVVKDRDGEPVPNPLLREFRSASEQVHRWSTVFGLTPSTRSQVRTKLAGASPAATPGVGSVNRLLSPPQTG